MKSNYAKALDLLKDNTPEQRLDVHLPYSMYSLTVIRCRYPRLSNNSFDEIATVLTIQRAMNFVSPIVPTGSMTEMGSGKYAKGLKEPDESFFYDDNNSGRLVLRVVVEAGHSEHYGRLLRDKDMWMKGMNAKAAVFICLEESPRFKNPHTVYEDIENVDLEVERMEQHIHKLGQRNIGKGFYGPPRFLANREFSSANIPDCNVCFDAHGYLRQLLYGTVLTARARYNHFIESN
ncbi:hypothetical protein V1525DRAFT_427299 [Lipomyces kononenkoae]|uniref:Uncharacterized protein n=1 Tax=Lipomyces kononenkoae TaxID=34357 RepID=A0ACC3SWY5_LIPKO